MCHIAFTHRVCIVDTQGHVVRSYGRDIGSADGQLDPCYLAVDTTDHVFVADYHKVGLFSSSLTHLGDVTLPGYQLIGPYRLHLDQLNARLYISEGNYETGGRLFVVSVMSD